MPVSRARVAILAAVAAAAVAAVAATSSPAANDPVTNKPQLLYGGEYSDCFWRVGAIGVENYNIAYPDAGAHYWGALWTPVPGATLRLKGKFPFARYTSLNSYDRLGGIQDTLSDFQWNPDKGSSNPFRPGVRRDVAKRSYTIEVSPDKPAVSWSDNPNRRANLPARNVIYTGTPGGDTIRGIALRVYIPNKGKDMRGGVSLPQPELTLADGTVLKGKAACAAIKSEEAQTLDPTALGDHRKDRCGRPRSAIDLGHQAVRNDPFQVSGQPTAGDVAEGPDLGFGRQCQAVLGVDAGRFEQFFAEGAAELLDMAGQVHPVDLQQDLAGQRVAVGVQAGRTHSDEDVTGADPLGTQQMVGLDHADTGRRDVVVVRFHQTGVFRGFATQ